MRKLLMTSFAALSLSIFAGEKTLFQEELLKKYEPLLKESPVYEKYRAIYARKAIPGEKISTITKDGLETINSAQEGDYIVKNQTEAQEEYIIPGNKFVKRYVYAKGLDSSWDEYKPLGEIKAIPVTEKETFYIMAPWGEKMVVKHDDYLVSPLDYSEIYRIANQEFYETYRIQK